MAAKKAKRASKPRSTSSPDLRCPDCSFVAAHPMGLGRHRSTRHGMISKRQARAGAASTGATGAWITRQQAADRVGVHYNTVRQWERTGVLRRGSRPGARETLVSAADVDRLAATRGGRGGGAAAGLGAGDAARLASLERAHRDLADGLERLAATLRVAVSAGASRGAGSRGRAARATTTAAAPTRKRRAARRASKPTVSKSAAKRGPTRAPTRRAKPSTKRAAGRAAKRPASRSTAAARRPVRRSTARRGVAQRTGAKRTSVAKRARASARRR